MSRLQSDHEPPEAATSPADAHGAAAEAERLQKALDLGYAYLNPRDRTIEEVRARLRHRGVSDDLAETAIRTLAEQGFLDDARFARLFVADKRRLEQWGSERIRRGLLTRGIGRELVEEALAEEAPAEDPLSGAGGFATQDEEPETELERALAVLRRRFPDPPQDRRERNRALGLLLRKGYESELALDALSAYARDD